MSRSVKCFSSKMTFELADYDTKIWSSVSWWNHALVVQLLTYLLYWPTNYIVFSLVLYLFWLSVIYCLYRMHCNWKHSAIRAISLFLLQIKVWQQQILCVFITESSAHVFHLQFYCTSFTTLVGSPILLLWTPECGMDWHHQINQWFSTLYIYQGSLCILNLVLTGK